MSDIYADDLPTDGSRFVEDHILPALLEADPETAVSAEVSSHGNQVVLVLRLDDGWGSGGKALDMAGYTRALLRQYQEWARRA
ncbi:hypothetical protein AB2L28_00910 [Kineococcus sp. TBRC 1896]|uniref:Uncharacterized protein n=1 Tax=Kineococcus mangrovi TaxID=1660183 RepID=A0ABV4I0K1_9ACTN